MLPSASTSPDLAGRCSLAVLVRQTSRVAALCCLLGLLGLLGWLPIGNTATADMAAEIVARIDGEIVTERDVARRSLLLQKKLATLLPTLRINSKDRQAFALDLLLQEILQTHHLVKERALPVKDSDVEKRLALLPSRTGNTANKTRERQFWEAFARHELTWEGYVGRVAEFNTPVSPEDALEERARLRTSAAEPRYLLEEIFLPKLEAGERTRRIAQAIYRALKKKSGSGSFARVASLLSAPYAREGLATQTLYKSALPPAVLDALEQGKVGAKGIAPPVTSPYGIHIYRIIRTRSSRKTLRYSFVQTFFLQSGIGQEQFAILSNPEFCNAPKDASLALQYYDLQAYDDVPEADLNLDLRQSLAAMSPFQTAGPFPFSQGLVVLVTLCSKQKAANRGDSFKELTKELLLKRARALSLRLVENLRSQAGIEQRADKTLSSLPQL